MGPTITTLCACTLADYSAGGTQTPVIGDAVTLSTTGNFYVNRCPDVQANKFGRVTKIELAPAGSVAGYVAVEWFDLLRLIAFPCGTLAQATLGNSIEKNGDTTVASDFDAPDAAGSNFVCWAKSAATGAGTLLGALFAKDN